MYKSIDNLMQQHEQQQNSGEMSSEHQSSEDVHGESTTTIDEAAIDGDADYTDDNNFESNLRRRKGKIISCAKETIEHASRQLRRKVPYAGHLMTPRRLWLNKIPTQCDVVIEFPEDAPDEALRWLLARIRSQPTAGLGLVVQVRAHESSRRNAFYISAPTNILFKAAEELRLPKRLRPDLGGALREFTTRESHCFQQLQTDEGSTSLFTSQERQWLVLQVLQGLRASQTDMEALQGRASVDEGQSIVAAWQESGLITQIFPLHETKTLTQLQKSWVKQIFAPQPLDDVAEYFGVKIALYFAWLGHYTSALSIPAIFGFLIYIIIWGRGQMIQDMGHVLFSLFNVAWASLYLEAWKRYSTELAFRWGTLSTPPELLEPPRPLYKGSLIENNVTGRLEPKEAPTWKRRAFRYFISFPIIGLCLLLVFVVMFIMLRFQDWLDSNHLTDKGIIQCMFNMHKDWFDSKLPQDGLICCLSVIPKVFLAGAITFMDEAYFKLAVWLNDKENYRLQSKYENHLIGKVALFQFVNSFLSLFYIAFYLRDEGKLKEQLAGLLISRQIIGNLRESAIPYFVEQWRLAKLSFNMWGALSPTQNINRTIINDTNDNGNGDNDNIHSYNKGSDSEKLVENIEEIDGNTAPISVPTKRTIKTSVESLVSVSTQLSTISNPNAKRNIGQAEIESSLYKYNGTFSDHLEMLVQMGYVVLFSAAFPLAGICALINNLLEIRSDAFKLAHVHQRPFGQRVANIGTWQNALSFLSLAAVIVNCALIGLSGQVSRLWPGLTTVQTIILIVTLEHIMLGLRSALTWLLPELPSWLAAEIARAEHCRREMQVKGTSPRPTPPSTTSTPAEHDMATLHLNGTGRITEICCEVSTTTTTTNEPSLTSQISEDIIYQQEGHSRLHDYEPFVDEISRYGLQRNVETDISTFESRDSTPDSPPSQTSTILIRPLHESTPPNSGPSLISLNDGSSGASGSSSKSSLALNATSTYRHQQSQKQRFGMHIPEIPPYRKKKSNDSIEHTGGSSASSSSPAYPRPAIMASIPTTIIASSLSSLPLSLTSTAIAMGPIKITEIPPYKPRKKSTESPINPLNLNEKHLPKAHVPEWMSRLKVNDHTNLHRSIDSIAKELKNQQDNVNVVKPAPSWNNVAIKSAAKTDTASSQSVQSQTQPQPKPPTSTPTPTSLKTMASQLSSLLPSSSAAGPISGLQRNDFFRSSVSSIPSSIHLHHQQHTTPKPPSSLSINEKERNVTTKLNVQVNAIGGGSGSGGSGGNGSGSGSVGNYNSTASGGGAGGAITDEEAKAAELAAKKNRLKQKLVKSARSVAIFSLKLKERRQREAEKAAAIAIEHAKALAKMPPQPQPGGELSLVPIEQLIKIEDIKPLILKATSVAITTTATPTATTSTITSKMLPTTLTTVADSVGNNNLIRASQSPVMTIPSPPALASASATVIATPTAIATATATATITTTNMANSPTTSATYTQLHQQQQQLSKQQYKQQHLHHPYSQSESF